MSKKKGFLLFFFLIFILSKNISILGAEINQLSLQDAFTMGMQSNYEMKMAKLKLDNARLDYEKNKADNILAASRYLDFQLERNFIQAKLSYRQTKDKALLEIAQQYLEIFKLKQERKLKSKQVELEEKTLRDWEKQMEKGYKTHLEILQQENKYHSAFLALKEVEDKYYQLTGDFEAKIGLEPGELKVELKEVATPTAWLLSEEEARELALKNSLTLQSLALETQLARIDLERAKIGPLLELDQKQLENNLELALLKKEQAISEMKNSVYKQYTSFRQTTEELALNRTHLEIVKKNYQLIQQLQAADLISLLDQISAEVELLQAEYQMQAAVTSFYLEKWKLQQLLGLELEVCN